MLLEASSVKWTDVGQVFVPLVVGLAGIPFIIFQLRDVNRSIQGETLSELYDHYNDVVRIFLEKPHLRPYFYDNQTLDGFADPDLRSQVATMCELMAGILEHAMVQERNVPQGSWKECWLSFVRERLKKSKELKKYLHANKEFYLKTLPDMAKDLEEALS